MKRVLLELYIYSNFLSIAYLTHANIQTQKISPIQGMSKPTCSTHINNFTNFDRFIYMNKTGLPHQAPNSIITF